MNVGKVARICCLLWCVSCWAQIVPIGNTVSVSSLSLAPGWTWIQDSYSTCTTGAVSCVLDNPSIIPTTAGTVLVVFLKAGNQGISISSVTGGGGTWNYGAGCSGCSVSNTGNDSISAAYNLAVTAGTLGNAITVNVTGTSSGYMYVWTVELLPPAGYAASFVTANTVTQTSCNPCTAAALSSPSGTMAIIQMPDSPSNVGYYNAWSSPYIEDTRTSGICLNCTSGTAPTVAMLATASWFSDVAIAFTSTAGTFMTSSPFTVRQVAWTPSNHAHCSNTCNIAVSATASGSLLYLQAEVGASTSISSIACTGSTCTGGSAFVIPTGASTCNINLTSGGTPGELVCAYLLSSPSGITSVNVTTSGTADMSYELFEITRTSGTFTLDAQNQKSDSIGSAGQASGINNLVSTGTNDVCFQIGLFPGAISSNSIYPYLGNSVGPGQLDPSQVSGLMAINTANTLGPVIATNDSVATYIVGGACFY